jgi:hypothetical protein
LLDSGTSGAADAADASEKLGCLCASADVVVAARFRLGAHHHPTLPSMASTPPLGSIVEGEHTVCEAILIKASKPGVRVGLRTATPE